MSHLQIGNHGEATKLRRQLRELTQLEKFQGSDYDSVSKEVDEMFESANGQEFDDTND